MKKAIIKRLRKAKAKAKEDPKGLLGKASGGFLLFVASSAALFLSRGSTLLIVSQLRQSESVTCAEATVCEREEVLDVREDSHPAWLWCLLLAITVPHMITLVRSSILTISKWEDLSQNLLPTLKGKDRFDWFSLVLQPLCSIIQMIGLSTLFFIALPEIASSKVGLVTCSTAVFPGITKIFGEKGKYYWRFLVNIAAVGLQLAVLTYYTYNIWESNPKPWSLPLGIILTSVGWWIPVWSSQAVERQTNSE